MKTMNAYSIRKIRMREHPKDLHDNELILTGIVIGMSIMFVVSLLDILIR
jgi:multisubunit Na+/H+ antiporter MnhC subunit